MQVGKDPGECKQHYNLFYVKSPHPALSGEELI